MTVPLRKRIKRSVRSALVRALVRLLAFVPLRPALSLATLVGRAGWRLAPQTRRQMLAQLAIAFPERTPAEREAIGRASFVHLAWHAAELTTLRTYRARLAEYVGYAPGAEERVAEALGRGKGLVFVTGHLGAWELMAQRVAARWPSAVIARTGNDPTMTALVGRMRAEGNLETLWREDPSTARAMIRTFKQGRPLGILIDQDTRVQSVFVPFFGRPARTPRGAAVFALKGDLPMIFVVALRQPSGRYVMHFEEVPLAHAGDKEAAIDATVLNFTQVLERLVREHPEQYFWQHRRWKGQPKDTPPHLKEP
jgi:KDO2-lipid IV(A) lauroyltransferase